MTRITAACVFIIALTAAAAARQERESFYLLIQRNGLDARETREWLRKGADPNSAGQHSVYNDTALVAAVRNDNLAVARVLVEAGANLRPPLTAANDTPLQVALRQSDDMFLFLLKKGADPNQRDRLRYPPLYWAASDRQHYDKAAMLIAAGADLDFVTEDGTTLLMLAAANRNTRMAELLARKGVNVNARDRFKETALMKAQSLRLAKFLVEHGAKINPGDTYRAGPIRDFLLANKPR